MENLNINEMIKDIECTMNSIPDIMSSKIILDDNGQIEEIHVLAYSKRNAKQISRDIQSAVTAKFHIKIDHKKISIAQVNSKDEIDNEYRLSIGSIGYSIVGNLVEVKVILKKDDKEVEAIVKGTNSKNNIYRLVGQATLDCVHSFLGANNVFIVEDIEKISLAKREVMNIAVTFICNYGEELLVGAAIVKKDDYEAIVKATLDAINRKIVQVDI
ncbi:hypothetical protein ACFIJ5_13570 [Haloimpatiens sp. FM7330]|uniref:hypothetical protein n=1 Tax=Haloimpatiens sp. FM7330 TaxID=3298610 RepID=UPI00362CD296